MSKSARPIIILPARFEEEILEAMNFHIIEISDK